MKHIVKLIWLGSLLWAVVSCQASEPPPLPPDEYLEAALSWMETHAANGENVDWPAVRREAQVRAQGAETTADTYPAIEYAIERLDGGLGYLIDPERIAEGSYKSNGLDATYPEGFVYRVHKNSPAELAGIRFGDIVTTVDGRPVGPMGSQPGEPQHDDRYGSRRANIPFDEAVSLSLRRQGVAEPLDVDLVPAEFEPESQPTGKLVDLNGSNAGYLLLDSDIGSEEYPTRVQALMREVDTDATCGWIIDLRKTDHGDIWSYIAATGPILGEAELGGFKYADGAEELWAYREDKVYWAGEERFESYVRGPIYEIHHPQAPVALLTGPLTEAAGELLVVAFHGRDDVRTFGAATAGIPHLNLHTPLSDGAELFVSGATGFDRLGTVYNGPIMPDENVDFDWVSFGGEDDAVLQAATSWLAEHPACQP